MAMGVSDESGGERRRGRRGVFLLNGRVYCQPAAAA
tara:strand:+ start:727 stop:834 length:108 start_codon:yes stop_codon:yes gene_type:complete